MHQFFQAQARVKNPAPDGAGDNHGQRHGIEINSPDRAFLADALVQKDRQHHADQQADADKEPAKYRQIP